MIIISRTHTHSLSFTHANSSLHLALNTEKLSSCKRSTLVSAFLSPRIASYREDSIRSLLVASMNEALHWLAIEIHQQLLAVYSETCMSIQMVHRWIKYYWERRYEIHNALSSGWPADSMIFENIQGVRNLLEEDHWIWMLSSYWVPHLLTDEMKMKRTGVTLMFLTN